MFILVYFINICCIKIFYGILNVGDDCVIMYLFNSCYGDERLLEFFVNIFNKIGWKFFRVIF